MDNEIGLACPVAIHECDITEVTTFELGSSYVLYLLSDEF